MIVTHTADRASRHSFANAPVIVTPIAARPACLPGSVAFAAARLPAPGSGNEAPTTASLGDLHASLPAELEPAVSKRRIEFLAGRLCARQAARQLNQPLPVVRRGPRGEPIWPAGLVGSIAHSDGVACAAVADASIHHAIGIDVERLCSAKDAERLAPMIFAPGERAAIGSWPEGEEDLFTLVFSLKEAIYKSIYPLVRRFVEFHEIALVRTGPADFAAEASPPLNAELGDWRLQIAVDRLLDHRFALSIAAPLEGIGGDGG